MLRCRELRPVQCLISPRLRSGLFLLEFLSVERLLRITIKNARIPCEIGRFRVQIMYILRKTLKIKVYCGERGLKSSSQPPISQYFIFSVSFYVRNVCHIYHSNAIIYFFYPILSSKLRNLCGSIRVYAGCSLR